MGGHRSACLGELQLAGWSGVAHAFACRNELQFAESGEVTSARCPRSNPAAAARRGKAESLRYVGCYDVA